MKVLPVRLAGQRGAVGVEGMPRRKALRTTHAAHDPPSGAAQRGICLLRPDPLRAESGARDVRGRVHIKRAELKLLQLPTAGARFIGGIRNGAHRLVSGSFGDGSGHGVPRFHFTTL